MKKRIKLWLTVWIFGFAFVGLIGCATTDITSITKVETGIPGTYHRIERGQTLWRISKIYHVDLDELARINRISDTANIETGRLIFIPQPEREPLLPKNSYSGEDFIWPLKGRVIAHFTQTRQNMKNKGIDIQPTNNLDVVASRSGKVVFYDKNLKGFGKTIIIDHQDGYFSVYARNAEVFIKAGDQVQKGTLITKAGSAGRDKNVYLHFEIRKDNISQNPYFYLAP